LIDSKGNIIDTSGKEIWKKEQLNHEGEPPKVLGFTKFNLGRIQGNYDLDAKGNPILTKGKKTGEFFDKDGNLVNKKGYLVDSNGNIID
jgi:hypothetical protein